MTEKKFKTGNDRERFSILEAEKHTKRKSNMTCSNNYVNNLRVNNPVP